MMVAGIGCRRGTPSEEILGLISGALAAFDVQGMSLDAIATEALKADEDGISSAARHLSVRLIRCPLAELERVAGHVITRSKRVQALTGVPSIAEASALVAAGRNARLLGARISNASATCAIAVGEGQ